MRAVEHGPQMAECGTSTHVEDCLDMMRRGCHSAVQSRDRPGNAVGYSVQVPAEHLAYTAIPVSTISPTVGSGTTYTASEEKWLPKPS